MEQNNPERTYSGTVVAVRFSALGDVAMTLPVLYSAAISNPETEFILLTRPAFTKFAINPPENLKIIGIDLKGQYGGTYGMAKLARAINREYKPQLLLDLHDVIRTKILRFFLRLSGTKIAVMDKGRREKKRLTRKRGKVLRRLTPMTVRYADTLRKGGIDPGDNFRSVFDITPADSSMFGSVTTIPEQGEHWIGMAPFAKHPGKIYPPELMEKVIGKLSSETNIRIFLFGGGPDEAAILGEWEKKYPRVISLADKKLGFATELTLMSYLDVMVSMDSGNMHLASLAGVPVVSIWGATHPFTGFMGFGQSEQDAIQLPLQCRPCSVFGNKKCIFGNYKCLYGISPDAIIDKVMQKIPN